MVTTEGGSFAHKWIEYVMKRSIIIIVSIVLIMGWGAVSAYQMERDYLPPIQNTALMVSVRADNYQADQIKASMAGTIERALKGVNGIEAVETHSFHGGLMSSLFFPYQYDMERAEREVAQALTGLTLPSNVEKPVITQVSTSSFPMMRLTLASVSEQGDAETLRTTITKDTVQRLNQVPGVSEIRVIGGGSSGYALTLRVKDMEKLGLTMEDIRQSLEASSSAWPQGKIESGRISIPVAVESTELNADDLLGIQVHGRDGRIATLADVAEVSPSVVDLQTVSRTNGNTSVILDVLKKPTASITDVSKRLNERIEAIKGNLPQGVKLSVAFDRAEEVQASLQGLLREGVLGCLFSMLSVLLFMRNVRATLLIALSLPVSLLATTALLKMMGISLNMITVSGMIVAMGRVVDDSIVILDNIYRKIHEADRSARPSTIAAAVREMLPAIVSSTATTIAVFLPILFVGGIVRASFYSFAWTVMIALLISLLVSIFVVPALAHLGRKEWRTSSVSVEPAANRLLQWGVRRGRWVIVAAILLMLATVAQALLIPVNLLPASVSGQISIKAELPEGSTQQTVDDEVRKAEELLQSEPSVQSFQSTQGSSFIPQFDDVFDDGGGWMQSVTEAGLTVQLNTGVNPDTFVEDITKKLWSLNSIAKFTVAKSNLSGDDYQLKVIVTGADAVQLDTVARNIGTRLQLVPGLSVAGTESAKENAKESGGAFRLVLKQDQLKQYGIEADQVLNRVQPYLSQGMRIDAFFADRSYPLLLNTDFVTSAKQSGEDMVSMLANETFRSKDGEVVGMKQLTSFTESHGLSVYRDRDGQPFAMVTANIIVDDVEKVTTQTENVLKHIELPRGVTYSFKGVSGQVNQMLIEMAFAISGSIVLVLLIVNSVFRGWKAPFSVLLCIPLSLIGSVWGMVLFGKQWNLAAFIGLLMLVGIVVTNGIVLVDKIERNLAGGMPPEEAIMQGTRSRVRPVLMTAFTTILTLLPLALSSRTDTVISQTLGVVIVGGMLSSTISSLLLIPIIYKRLHKRTVSESAKPIAEMRLP